MEAPVDIVAKGFDAGIGGRYRAAADMIAVRVMGPTKIAVVGSPAYIAERGAPRTPDDLANPSCIQTRRADGGTFDSFFAPTPPAPSISVRGQAPPHRR